MQPTDLIPLPTQPWDERPSELPLDVEECRTAIWRAKGNVTQAAEILKVRPQRLRAFVKNKPSLFAELQEAREQLQDIAETVVEEALLDSDDTGRRDTMARFVLTQLGSERGYGGSKSGNGKGVGFHLPSGGRMVIQWDDGSDMQDGPVIEGEAVPEAAE